MTRQFLLIGLYGCVVQFYYIALKLFYNPQIIFCALLLCVVNFYKIYANNVPACSPIGNGVIITSTLIHTLRCLVTTLVDAYTGVVQGVTDVSRITPSYTGLCTTFSLIYIIIKKTPDFMQNECNFLVRKYILWNTVESKIDTKTSFLSSCM